MKRFRHAIRWIDRPRTRLGCFVVLLNLQVLFCVAQERPKAVVNSLSLSQASGSRPDTPEFTDVTSTVNINFDYVASHTTKKYQIETMGSGVALFDYDNDVRLDIYVVNGALLADTATKGTIPKKTGLKDWNWFFPQKKAGTFEDVADMTGCHSPG